MSGTFKVRTSIDHATFSVWPENANSYYDVMQIIVDGHFRPCPEKTWDYEFECDWWDRVDLFKPKEISTEARIRELSFNRSVARSKGFRFSKGEFDGASGASTGPKSPASVVASRVSAQSVINTDKSTMHGGGGLLETVNMAYNFDKDLVLTPDDVFLTILVGVNSHVAKDPEKCRHAFVNFEGKKEICIESNFSPDVWEERGVFDEFSQRIREQIGAKWHDAILCDFSTTTPLEKLLSQLGLMEATSHYFDFRLTGMCGIKTITLSGTVEDWRRLRAKIDVFSVLDDLEWWLQDLRLVLDQFVLARQGIVTSSFWRRMVNGHHSDKEVGLYFTTAHQGFLSGWVLALFPYTKSGRRVRASTCFEQQTSQRSFAECGACVECGRLLIAGESGCGEFYCKDCWHAYDLMKRWSNVWVEQSELHDGLASANITWEQGSAISDVKIYGGLIGPSVPVDKSASLHTVRGFVMEVHPRK